MRCADPTEALLDAADHHVANHLAGDAGGGLKALARLDNCCLGPAQFGRMWGAR
jgi:hypothetical protein